MRFRPRSLGLLVAFVLLAGPASAGGAKAVVELFTSQGCSACPPADRLLGELSLDNRLIALSLNVDYWDYLGWRDTLALSAHSIRQKGYADHRGDRQVYTPQVVINGVAETNGSDRDTIEHIVAGIHIQRTLDVPVVLNRGGTDVEIEVGAGAGPSASVWILAVTKMVPVAIKRGENKGKKINYYNVVRGWTRIGEWNGKPLRTSLPIAELAQSGADAAAVLVQAGSVADPGPIRGAAMIGLR